MVRLKTDRDKDEEDFYWSEPTKQQLQELHMDIKKAGGRNKFLISIGVMKEQGNGYAPAVVYSDSMKGTTVRKGWDICYRSNILYFTWNQIFDRLDKYEYGLEMYRKEQEKLALEKTTI